MGSSSGPLRYEPTFNLGHLLTIATIVISMLVGCWYLSSQVQQAVSASAEVARNQAKLESRQDKLEQSVNDRFVHQDVDQEYRESVKQQLSQIESEIQAINSKIGLAAKNKTSYWK